MDGRLRVVTTETRVVAFEAYPGEITTLVWHPKGNILLAATADASIWMWMLPSGTVLHVLAGPHTAPISALQFTPDGKKIVSSSEDGVVVVWDPKQGEPAVKWGVGGEDARWHQGGVHALAVRPDSGLIATGGEDGACKLLSMNGHIAGSLEQHTESIETLAFCESLPLLATGSVDGTVCIWDVNTLILRHKLQHDDAVVCVAWSSGTPWLYTTSVDRTLRRWDARTGVCEQVWHGHQDAILCMAVSSDGNMVVTGSDDGCALVFRAG